jgi:hypothetical protein
VTADASSALLRRLERGALIWCGVAAAGVFAAAPGRTDIVLGVLGGGLVSIVSFYAIRGTVDAILRTPPRPAPGVAAADAAALPSVDPPDQPPPPAGRAGVALKLAGRYALLALLAYVMIARLRLHPLGLLLGMTALAASATAEAVRSLGRPGRAT